MTREEAIERLEFLKVVYDLDTETALDMAIEALSAENSNAKTQNSNQEIQKSNGETIKWLESLKVEIGKSEYSTLWYYAEAIDMAIEALSEPSGDIISRQDAVNTIKRYKHRLEGKGQTYGFLLEEFEHQIPSASADAAQGWIPCSERLPSEKDGIVLVTTLGDVRTARYSEFSGTWYFGDMCAVGGEDPIAWMPLPKPYKGGGE